jgi:hypothetical protein
MTKLIGVFISFATLLTVTVAKAETFCTYEASSHPLNPDSFLIRVIVDGKKTDRFTYQDGAVDVDNGRVINMSIDEACSASVQKLEALQADGCHVLWSTVQEQLEKLARDSSKPMISCLTEADKQTQKPSTDAITQMRTQLVKKLGAEAVALMSDDAVAAAYSHLK